MWIAVVGKGGAGKSVLAGTLARVLARSGERVLAIDSDLMPGLAISLGADPPAEPPLNAAAEQDENGRWRLKKGIGPVRAVQRYSTPAPDGVRLLQCGKTPPGGLGPITPSLQAFYRVIHRLPRAKTFRDWTIIGDLSAGPRQTAFDWAPFAETYLVVTEPTWKSMLTARRVARIARSRGGAVYVVASKVEKTADTRKIARIVEEEVVGAVPLDPDVRDAERLGVALIDHAPESKALHAIETLSERLREVAGGR